MRCALLLPSSSHLQRVGASLYKVRVLSRPAVHLQTNRKWRQLPLVSADEPGGARWVGPDNGGGHWRLLGANLDLRTEAVEEGLPRAVEVLAHPEGVS